MIHSGINCYLTLHVAQVLLRAGDERYLQLMHSIADHASDTCQWPEAVHPRTGGGSMGYGQHLWAASEWLMMIRHCFVRVEGERLILTAGIPPAWLKNTQQPLTFGPAPTAFGNISIHIEPHADAVTVSWQSSWRSAPAAIEVHLPGFAAAEVSSGQNTVTFARTFADGVKI
jgi:hypothetical protein